MFRQKVLFFSFRLSDSGLLPGNGVFCRFGMAEGISISLPQKHFYQVIIHANYRLYSGRYLIVLTSLILILTEDFAVCRRVVKLHTEQILSFTILVNHTSAQCHMRKHINMFARTALSMSLLWTN